jgi:hypothetical protein
LAENARLLAIFTGKSSGYGGPRWTLWIAGADKIHVRHDLLGNVNRKRSQ